MTTKTEVIFKDEVIGEVNDTLPLNIGDECYFSVREFSPRAEKEYRDRYNDTFPKEISDNFLESIKEKCKNFHIKLFKVVNISKSLFEDYNRGLVDRDNLHHFVTSITVEEV